VFENFQMQLKQWKRRRKDYRYLLTF